MRPAVTNTRADMRPYGQIEAFSVALQMLGDLTGFDVNYFDMDDSRGYVKTAAEVWAN